MNRGFSTSLLCALLAAALLLAACGSRTDRPVTASATAPATAPAAAPVSPTSALGEPSSSTTGAPPDVAPPPESTPASGPLPSQTPESAPLLEGQVAFQSDFSDLGAGWLEGGPADPPGEVVDGAYRMAVDNDAAPGEVRLLLARQDYGDVMVEVDLRLASEVELGSAGVVCRYLDPANYYAFLVDGRNAEILRVAEGEREVLVYDLPNPAILPEANHLKVSCTGPVLEMWVNGESVAFTSDYTLRSGDVGLAADGGDSGQTEVSFDNFSAIGFSPADSLAIPLASPTPLIPPTREASAQASVDPCSLLTPADAEEFMGQPVGEPQISQVGPFQECMYTPADGSGGMLGIQVQPGVTLATFETQAESGAEFLDEELVEVPGDWDKAYWYIGILQVLKGDVFYQYVAYLPQPEQDVLSVVTELATRAAARLP